MVRQQWLHNNSMAKISKITGSHMNQIKIKRTEKVIKVGEINENMTFRQLKKN